MRKQELRDKIEKLNIVVKNWKNRVIDKDEQIELLKEQYEELKTKCDYYEKVLTATQKEKIVKLKEQELKEKQEKEKQAKIEEEKVNKLKQKAINYVLAMYGRQSFYNEYDCNTGIYRDPPGFKTPYGDVYYHNSYQTGEEWTFYPIDEKIDLYDREKG